VEPVNHDFALEDLLVSSLQLYYQGNGISATIVKGAGQADRDGNGIADLAICFSKADLRTLFGDLPHGPSTVEVRLDGSLSTGAHLEGSLQVLAYGGPSAGTALVLQNPSRGNTVITFRTTAPGPVRARVFDSAGRLTQCLLDLASAPVGFHELRLDRLDGASVPLPSGVYFYVVETPEGQIRGRFVLMK
jgi:hypothetical protein